MVWTWKTTRQPATLVDKDRGGEILKSFSARTITFYNEKTWPACFNERLRPKSCDLKSMRASTLGSSHVTAQTWTQSSCWCKACWEWSLQLGGCTHDKHVLLVGSQQSLPKGHLPVPRLCRTKMNTTIQFLTVDKTPPGSLSLHVLFGLRWCRRSLCCY